MMQDTVDLIFALAHGLGLVFIIVSVIHAFMYWSEAMKMMKCLDCKYLKKVQVDHNGRVIVHCRNTRCEFKENGIIKPHVIHEPPEEDDGQD